VRNKQNGLENKETHPTLPSTLYTEEYFLTACEGHVEFVESEGEQLSRRLASVLDVASIEPGMILLDVGCGRGEVLRHCAQLGADIVGIDYALVAVTMTRELIARANDTTGTLGAAQADAKNLPFPTEHFDQVFMFDVVEHLYPWELDQALREVRRVLKPGGKFVVHTAPNRWYDRYAYPLVRMVRHLMGQGTRYPKNPRQFGVGVNQHVHVNEQDILSLRRTLRRAGFRSKVWLETPPQQRDEGVLLAALRHVAFNWPPFRLFFEREVFAIATKV